MPKTVTARAVVDLWLPSFGMTPVTCGLRYDPADPYAVTVSLDHTDGGATTWTFERSLLADGLAGKAGDGNVRVWRVTSGVQPMVAMALTGPGLLVHLYADLIPLVDFLTASYSSVPLGAEPEHLDLDAEIAALLRDE